MLETIFWKERVDAAFFDKMAAERRAEQSRYQREIDGHQEADKSYMDEGAQILELARNTQQLFERQEPRQKRHSTLYYRTALGKTAKSLPPSANHLICWQKRLQSPRGQRSLKSPILTKSKVWLPFLDTYRTMCLAPDPPFRRVLEEVRTVV